MMKLLASLNGEKQAIPPIWMMRQAGRHLPEYRELRARNKSFLDFCYAPAAASEATLQPVRRYDVDAAIIFSDILVIPHAMGMDVKFVEGEGPVLEKIETAQQLAQLKLTHCETRLAPVYEALSRVRRQLAPEKALLGFAGSPLTLATYMVQGKGGGRDQARIFGFAQPTLLKAMLDVLVEAVAAHLIAQIDAGADAVQLFESWAEDLNDLAFEQWVLAPNAAIVEKVRAARPKAKIIGFPRGASARAALYYARTGVDCVGLDIGADVGAVRATVGENACLQGNLDPCVLVAGGEMLDKAVSHLLEQAKSGPHIINLGHGIMPGTPIAHVAQFIARVRSPEHHT